MIADFDSTVLLVSHDRDLLDRMATTTITMEGDGKAVIYAGGWSDYRAQRGERPPKSEPKKAAKPAPKAEPKRAAPARLTFAQQRRLDELPGEIDRLEAEIARLEDFLSTPDLFTREPAKFRKASEGLAERQQRLAEAEEKWLELEDPRESLGQG